MEKSIISEGKTTNEAIENGLRELKATKDMVDIKILETEHKKSFFSILEPRIVKVQLTIKEKKENVENKSKREIILTEKEQERAEENIRSFMEEFLKFLPNGTVYNIEKTNKYINVNINNKDLGYLIGYRGEALYAFQNILSTIAGKGIENRVRVVLDIENYKAKREKTLEELAEKVAKQVIKFRKSYTFEPMQAYERKIIHSKLQGNPRVETESIGEEPYRKLVVSLKHK